MATERPPSFASERLRDDHELDNFTCGKPALDDWLKTSARHVDALRTGRTYVWTHDSREVVAFFTIAPHVVRKSDLGPIGRGSPDLVPTILLARLALARGLQGQGLGRPLLLDVARRTLAIVEAVGGRFLVVDAVDEAAVAFYEHFGFRRAIGDAQRLVMKTNDVRLSVTA